MQSTEEPVRTGSGPGRPNSPEIAALQRTSGNRAAATAVQRARQDEADADARANESPRPADEADLQSSRDPQAVMVRLSASIEANALQKKRKFNFWELHKKWPEDWLPEKTRLQWVLERRLVLGKTFQPDELADIELLSEHNAAWLNGVGIGTVAEGRRIAAGMRDEAGGGEGARGKRPQSEAAEQERATYANWLKLTPGRRILAATLALHSQAPGPGAAVPTNPAYTLGRFMRTQELPGEDEERAALAAERDGQILETTVDTLFPEGLRAEQLHESAATSVTPETRERDDFARTILTNVMLLLQNGLQIMGADGTHADYREGDVVRALAHGGRVNIRIPALREGENAHQLLDFLGATANGTPHRHLIKRDFATHRSSIGKNKPGAPGKFTEKGGVGASLTNMASAYTPGVATPQLLAANLSGGGLGTKDWNGDVVLPNGSYGHMLLVFTEPTADKDGSLLVGIETVAPHAPSPVGYHHGIRSTEATANPESVLHGHKQDKIGAGKLKDNQRLVDLGKMGGADWYTFLQEIKQKWVDRLAAAQDAADQRELYRELAGPRA
ncbi:PE-PGRS family protein [Streptomyces sp. NPDC048696]|uniref:PE-PGRS family protein n=1 Tax=Streptomyces sp. NPDC048696 TaxID=3365585 RepID=UPI0037102E05